MASPILASYWLSNTLSSNRDCRGLVLCVFIEVMLTIGHHRFVLVELIEGALAIW
jgi:hypothetical protein